MLLKKVVYMIVLAGLVILQMILFPQKLVNMEVVKLIKSMIIVLLLQKKDLKEKSLKMVQ